MVSISDDLRKRIQNRIKKLKDDIFVELLTEDYPIIRDFLENPRPFSVATFGGYIKLMRNTDYTNETIRKRIIELEQHYIDILNEKLSVLGGIGSLLMMRVTQYLTTSTKKD